LRQSESAAHFAAQTEAPLESAVQVPVLQAAVEQAALQ
jgi:hypothetical protein